MMSQHDVVEAIQALEAAGVAVWLDGGWAVDAVLGRQTRSHDDLDVVIALDQSADAQAALAVYGYQLSADERPTRFVLCTSGDRCIDVHTVTFDAEGGGTQQLPNGRAFRYPPAGFGGMGRVAGRDLHCLSPAVQLLCHVGYEPDENDRHDVQALCETLGLALPQSYHDQDTVGREAE